MARVPDLDQLEAEDAFTLGDGGDGSTAEDEALDAEARLAFSGSGRAASIVLGFTCAFALLGALLAASSTSDFVQHLDRQVHAIRCSVMPGAAKELGESGCRTVMLSPYSSIFRDSLWGGVPISLWALAVFAFLAYRALDLAVRKRPNRGDAFFLLAATLLPCLMSAVYGWISVTRIGSICTVCLGIYWASGLTFAGALVAFLLTPKPSTRPIQSPAPLRFAASFGEGVGFVAVLTAVYLAFVPPADAEQAAKGCGTLVQAGDPDKIMFALGPQPGGADAIELLDPLCPACRAFDARLSASGLAERLDQRAVLFPLDAECNWMVPTSLHPGACAVSEAILCASGAAGGMGDAARARAILAWAFEQQETLLADAREDPARVRGRLEQAFPEVRGCLGGAVVKNKLVRSLRWAVANALPVLTPQLFVRKRRLCDEDTDLGLEYTLGQILGRAGPGRIGR